MKTKSIFQAIFLFSMIVFVSAACVKDKIEDQIEGEAELEIRNSSTNYSITGIYYAKAGFGNNRLSAPLEPGGIKKYTLDLSSDNYFNIKIESNDPDYLEYELTKEYMSRNSTLIVSLWDDGWDYNDDWLFKK